MRYSFLLIKKSSACLVLLFLISALGFSQENNKPAVESFEFPSVLEVYKAENGKLSLSEAHRRYGKSSLQWEWTGASTIGTPHFKILTQKESPLAYGEHFPASPTLQMSLYNETPQEGVIRISFEKNKDK